MPVAVRSQQFARRDKTSMVAGVYPWRDNFCEARSFNVGQCASGFGHQGQDIRPRPCAAEESAETCDDKRQPIVAVRDGVVIRSPKQQAATLQINTRTEHIRFRYMHMNPSAMDNDGLLNGRRVNEGEQIGVVSNYLDRPNGTSRHLHFDVQVFTRDGWLWVNPYTTLVSAYERLIHARGREIGTDPVSASAVAHAMPQPATPAELHEGGEN
jgi:murein DD-endopeptidase MepM/ murein hydrolase activator NlpD